MRRSVVIAFVLLAACGTADSIPESETPDAGDGTASATLGTSCNPAGALACNGHAQKLQLLCEGGVWAKNGVCPGQQLCDTMPGSTAGSCQEPIAACVGKTPGISFCDAAVRVTCGPDLLTVMTKTCIDAAHCTAGVGTECAKSCTPGDYRCAVDTLETCNAAGSGYDPVKICPPGGCDAARHICVECKSGDKGCEGNTPHACDSTGHWKLLDPCASPMPKCVDGLCVSG